MGKTDSFLRNIHFLAETGYYRKSVSSLFFFLLKAILVEKVYSVSVDDKTWTEEWS